MSLRTPFVYLLYKLYVYLERIKEYPRPIFLKKPDTNITFSLHFKLHTRRSCFYDCWELYDAPKTGDIREIHDSLQEIVLAEYLLIQLALSHYVGAPIQTGGCDVSRHNDPYHAEACHMEWSVNRDNKVNTSTLGWFGNIRHVRGNRDAYWLFRETEPL